MDSQVPAEYPDIFGLLSKKSLAKIKAVKSQAVAELLPALSQVIESIAVNLDGLAEHDRSVFFPPFERYTERQYDAYAEELLPHFTDVSRYVWHLATDVTDRISNEIRPEPEFVRNGGFGRGGGCCKTLPRRSGRRGASIFPFRAATGRSKPRRATA